MFCDDGDAAGADDADEFMPVGLDVPQAARAMATPPTAAATNRRGLTANLTIFTPLLCVGLAGWSTSTHDMAEQSAIDRSTDPWLDKGLDKRTGCALASKSSRSTPGVAPVPGSRRPVGASTIARCPATRLAC